MTTNFRVSVREGREDDAKGAKNSGFSIGSFRVLRESFAPFAYGDPFFNGGAQ